MRFSNVLRCAALLCTFVFPLTTDTLAQHPTDLWNAAKRAKLGLDPISSPSQQMVPGTDGVSTENPLSPPNSPDVQVFDPSLYWQSENSIGVNFTNPDQLMVSTNGRIPGSNPVVHQTWAFSTDGGLTWPSSMQSENIPPGINDCYGDPVAFFDQSGRAYYCTLGSPGGIYFVSTTNFGATWSSRTNADPTNSANDDKQHAAADYSGTFPTNVYAAWTDFTISTAPVIFNRSTNQGQTWGVRQQLQIGSNRGQGVHIAIGPNGEVYLMWAHYTGSGPESGIGFARSTDGGVSFSTPTIAFPIVGIRETTPSSTWNGVRVNSFPYHDVDRSNGPRRGWIYCTYSDRSAGNSDVIVRRSTNGGTTWSAPIVVDDQPTGRQQFFSSIAVDPNTGGVTVSYYNMDSVGTNFMTNRYAAYSADGGNSWEKWVISDVRALWAPQGTPSTNATYNGDYYETAAAGGKAWATWTDRRSGSTGSSNRAYVERIVYGEHFGWVRGMVTSGGSPLAGVAIDFVEPLLQQTASTLVNGSYFAGAIVDTPATTANVTLRARKFGYLDSLISVTLTRNDTLTRDFTMTALDLVLPRTSLTFPPTPAPGISRDSVIARNQGSTPLTLNSLSTSNPRYSVTPSSGSIPAADSVWIYVTYSPAIGGTDTGRVVILSSSLYTPRVDVLLTGTAIGVPKLTSSVDSVTSTLEGGTRDSVRFRMRNIGTSTAVYAGRVVMYPRPARPGISARSTYVPLAARYAPPGEDLSLVARSVLLISDNPGLLVRMSDDPANPQGASSSIIYRALIDAGYNVDTISFASHNPIVYPNYDLVIWSAGANASSPSPFADASKRAALVARVNSGGKVWVEGGEVGSRYRWQPSEVDANFRRRVLHDSAWVSDVTSSNLRFIVPSHPIFQTPNLLTQPITFSATSSSYYRDAMTLIPGDAGAQKIGGWTPTYPDTAGLIVWEENGTPTTVFTAFAFGAIADTVVAKRLAHNVAAWLVGSRAPWMAITPAAGSLAVSDSVQMTTVFNAIDPTIYEEPGEYLGRIEVRATNSTLADVLEVPVRMFVIPPPNARLQVQPDSLNFGEVEVDSVRSLSVRVKNIGGAPLVISAITASDSSFAATPVNFTLAPLDTLRVSIRFAAPRPAGIRTGTMQFASNDPLAPWVRLVGRSIGVAHISVRPDSLSYMVAPGDSATGTVQIHNTGMEQLTYSGIVEGAQSTDVLGNATSNLATSSGLIRGSVVQPNETTTLSEIRSWLTISADRELRYVVYENTIGTTFTKIHETVVANSGTGGPQWYSSGTISVVLEAGKRYAIGVAWPAVAGSGLTYYWQATAPVPIAISFGTVTGGFASATFPPPSSLSQSASSSLYNLQLVTGTNNWLSITSGASGTVSAGDSSALGFTIRTSGLMGGLYNGVVRISNNDPLGGIVRVPVRLEILPNAVDADGPASIPATFALDQNYPNPFNPTTTIRYALPMASHVALRVYTILGQELVTLVDEIQTAAFHTVQWKGDNQNGQTVPSGVYFVRIDAVPVDRAAAPFMMIRKMVLLK
jgi:hypothetical protein